MRFKAEVKGRHIRRGLVVIDTAILTRSSSVGSIYRRIGIDGILRNEINAPNENAPQDRWEKISLHANLEIGSWRENGTHITIALQRPLDASLKSSERLRPEKYMSWIIKTISQLQHKTDLPIHIRSHPDSLQQEDEQKWLQSVKNKISDDVIWDTSPVPFKTAMENCALCVTYNSGASVDAALLGVPVMACDPGSFAWDISIHNTENWNPNISYTPARQQWLNNLSYMEWSIEEMEEGLPWQHLRQELSKQLF